jgi:hypothetical protein
VDLVYLTLNDLHYYHYGPSGTPTTSLATLQRESIIVIDSNRTTCQKIIEICGDTWKEERRTKQRSIIVINHRQCQMIVRSTIERDYGAKICSDDNNP